MPRGYKLYLEDIFASITKIQNYIGDSSYEDFVKDEMKIDAVVRNLEIIGEASRNIPDEIKQKYPKVEWRKITDFSRLTFWDRVFPLFLQSFKIIFQYFIT